VLQYDGRYENEYIFYMVFEYMDKDLDHYIHQCAVPGLGEPKVKVRRGKNNNSIVNTNDSVCQSLVSIAV